jgi:hypothetical protein
VLTERVARPPLLLIQHDRVATRWTGVVAPGHTISGITIDRFVYGMIVEAWRAMVDLNR